MPFPVDEKWILEAEKRLKVALPKEYKASISQINGGSIIALEETWDLYPIWDKSDRKRLKRHAMTSYMKLKSAMIAMVFRKAGLRLLQMGAATN